MFIKVLEAMNIPVPVKEFKFHHTRQWRFDYAWPQYKIALEVEGGIFGYTDKQGNKRKGGAHSSVTGILRDLEKYNSAAVLGYRIIRVQPSDLMKTSTIEMIKKCINNQNK